MRSTSRLSGRFCSQDCVLGAGCMLLLSRPSAGFCCCGQTDAFAVGLVMHALVVAAKCMLLL